MSWSSALRAFSRSACAFALLAATSCAGGGPEAAPTASHDTFGSIERIDPALDAILAPGAEIERLARGFGLPEGPVWDPRAGRLLFSDVGRDVIYRWQPADGVAVFLRGVGDTGHHHTGLALPGANGLALDAEGRLLLCEHGNRQVARLRRDGRVEPLATHFEGKRLNSPNDLAVHPNGDVYFTDPPLGMRDRGASGGRELAFSGLFRLRPDGRLELVARDLEPNGIALAPDARTLYVSHRRSVLAFELAPDGAVGARRTIFHSRAAQVDTGGIDGLAVDPTGHVFAACLAGVLVLGPDGRHLGTLHTDAAATNCEVGEDGRSLFVTAGDSLARVRLEAAPGS